MQEEAVKKEDALKQSFKIVELMDCIRDKDKNIDERQDFIIELQDKENKLSLELGNAQGVIETLQHNISAKEKEILKESKLRKEEQRRLLELIEQKQALEGYPEEVSKLSHENQTLNNIIKDYKQEIKNLEGNLQSQIAITNNKSSTIKDYEYRLENSNELASQKQCVIKQLEEQIESLRTDIYDHK